METNLAECCAETAATAPSWGIASSCHHTVFYCHCRLCSAEWIPFPTKNVLDGELGSSSLGNPTSKGQENSIACRKALLEGWRDLFWSEACCVLLIHIWLLKCLQEQQQDTPWVNLPPCALSSPKRLPDSSRGICAGWCTLGYHRFPFPPFFLHYLPCCLT